MIPKDYDKYFSSAQKSALLQRLGLAEKIRDFISSDPKKTSTIRSMRNGQIFVSVSFMGNDIEVAAYVKLGGTYKEADNALLIGGTFWFSGAQKDFRRGSSIVGLPNRYHDYFPIPDAIMTREKRIEAEGF